nr:immunoglobulin light chain junction region [Macaca mulatta]MOY04892.1 immunoglobulin light chain junction region [Macaca mulatta]MOY06582.1 immunoglobulin light chain junction region [Macaca mulatta]MOY07041.1 immunoglobulin light chain junction region [Macaca mulatta]MOY08551.1 immunoglobulin light chain junction region [Macaca mulatta]
DYYCDSWDSSGTHLF